MLIISNFQIFIQNKCTLVPNIYIMNKKLLLIGFCALAFTGTAQTLETANFNALTLGNVGTDFTAATAGQDGYLTASSNGATAAAASTSTNAGNDNFQIVTAGENGSNGLQITSPNGDRGSRFMWKTGLPTSWAARTAGNNVIEVEYSFYTGPVTDSRMQSGMRLYTPSFQTIGGFVYTHNTRSLSGVQYANNNGTPGTFTITLATGGIILNPDTWYRVGFSYNTVTGQVLYKSSPTATSTGLPAGNWVAGQVPAEVNFLLVAVTPDATSTPPRPANTVTSTIVFDNYISRASATSDLLGVEDALDTKLNVQLFPNPTADFVNVTSSTDLINAIQIMDINGRIVKSIKANTLEVNTDVSDLAPGMYLMNVATDNGAITKKLIKG